jgi:hypothetical protein
MDDRVASAIAHWAPRFTANGVSCSDFRTVTTGIERWEDWCAAWSTMGAAYEELGRDALAAGRTLSGAQVLAQASLYFHFGKFVFVEDLTQMRWAHERSVACMSAALGLLPRPGRRVEMPFEGSRLVANFRTPQPDGVHPVVVLLPGLDSTKEELRATEETFLDRGMATFSVDGPGQGEAEYDLPLRGDWSAPAQTILEKLRELPEVNAARVGVWGVSLGDVGAGLRGTRRPVQLRRLLGPAARAHAQDLRGARACL